MDETHVSPFPFGPLPGGGRIPPRDVLEGALFGVGHRKNKKVPPFVGSPHV